jgi:membrane protein
MMKWLRQLYRRIRAILHRQTLPGFNNIPIAVILKWVWKEILRDDIVTRSNSMAFSFFISIFPGILVLLSLLPYLPIGDLVSTFRHSYVDLLPEDMANYIDGLIIEMTAKPRQGLLGFSVLLAVFFASNGVSTMIKGFHKSYEVSYKKQNIFQRYWRALKITLLLGLLFLGSLLAVVFGRPTILTLFEKASIHAADYTWFNNLRWLLVFVLYYLGISIIYRVGPALKNKLRLFTPGATLATILSVISSFAFAAYVENFSNYNQVYGSIGVLILILVWLQLNSFIILIGYELNASIAINRDLLTMADADLD